MDRLNYFNPYNSKDGHNEDQLTRAYLVLLKHSFHAFSIFFEYAKDKHTVVSEIEQSYSLYNLLDEGWEIETQKGNPIIETNWLLSVLITDAELENFSNKIVRSERGARYDGVITFGSKLTIIIEVKPRSSNVWSGQLNPASNNLSEETRVYSNPSCLEWKVIVRQLNNLLSMPTISGYEKVMIEDFLVFIDENFAFLNPYDRFDLCKGNAELLKRRIKNILEAIVIDKSLVNYHHGWGFFIQIPYHEIRKIGLILGKDKENKWFIELSLYYGANQSQAKSFYRFARPIEWKDFSDWGVYGNFHVSFMTTNLVWFGCAEAEEYMNYWINNTELIHQQKREDVPKFLRKLVEDKVITVNLSKQDELEEKFYDTAMQTLNIVPEVGFLYSMPLAEAERIDRDGYLETFLIEKIKLGLSIIGKNGIEFLR